MYTLNITLNPHDASDPGRTKLTAAEMLGIDVRTISNLRIKKRSIDARQRNITIHLTVDVYIGGEQVPEEFDHIEYRPVSNAPEVIVVGAGPGGLFAALQLIELGLKPVVLERGKDVHERKRDIARIRQTQRIDPESNYSFGEGGSRGLLGRQTLYAQQKTWECEQDSFGFLPARSRHRHTFVRTSTSWHRPPAAHYRKHP